MRKLLSIALLLIALSAFADDSRVVDAFYRYVIPDNCSQSEAKGIAMERAITEALANEFGTTVHAETMSEVSNTGEKSATNIWRLGSSVVKGQWIETIGEPQFKFLSDGTNLVVEVRMRGRVIPLADRHIDLQVETQRFAKDGVFVSQHFHSGDKLELNFTSPVDGNLLVFLSDEDGIVSQLLPFPQQSIGAFSVTEGKNYLFFRDNKESWAEQYQLSTTEDIERNLLYIIFSPNHIVKPVTTFASGIRFLSEDAFRRWLGNRRNTDKDLQIRTIPITIRRNSKQ